MIKVSQYIETMGCEKFKKFLAQSFDINMLFQISDNNIIVLFDGWRGKNMGTWYKFTNDDNVVLEFYSNEYNIQLIKGTIKQTLSLPSTLNDFINDMNRYNVQLYWGEWIDVNFEPKEYLHKDEIRQYYVDLLSKMDKSHELL